MSDKRVLVSDKLSAEGIKILEETEGLSVDVKVGLAPDELEKIIGDYDGLIIRSATKVTRKIIDAATKLKVVGRAGIGVDNVDTPAASAKGVVVMNTPGGNIVTTAEHAISLMMSLARHIPQANASVKGAKWEKSKFTGVEISDKTLGIIGIGRIGSIVADRAHGLNMTVIAFDPYISAAAAEKIGVELVSLDALYEKADFISIHAQLTDDTRGMISTDAFGKMKTSCRIVNCARGGIIDETALATAVTNGDIAGAALDVFAQEPPEEDNPLRNVPGVVMTPHLGASTAEAQLNVAVDVAHQVADYLTRDIIRNAINVPSIAPEELPVIRPYLDLGERLGNFLAQATTGAAQSLSITYLGELAEINQKPITQAIVKGVMEAYVGKTVNMVNAALLAETRGVTIASGTSSEKRNFTTLLRLTLTTDKETRTAEATLFLGNEPRLVHFSDAFIEAKLLGDMLIFVNKDVPGVIGDIGGYLGKEKMNIADFALGRENDGGKALSILNIDTAPSGEQITAMKKIAHVLDVVAISLEK